MVQTIIYYHKKGLSHSAILKNLLWVFGDKVTEEGLTLTDIEECITLWEDSRYN